MTETCASLNVRLIFNGTYSSPFQPIERAWAYAKRAFARDCLKTQNFRDKQHIHQLVTQSLDQVPVHSMGRHVKRCVRDMFEWLD